MLDRMQLNGACATRSHKTAVICTSIAWAVVILSEAFTAYSLFFSGGDLDIALAPIGTHVNLPDLLVPRVLVFLASVYNTSAWIFPHAMSFMLASVFTHQYKVLNRSFYQMLAKSDERRLSDSDIEIFRQHHDEISTSINETDDFLMFHNAGAFCCQLSDSILHLYDLIFFYGSINDPVIFTMRIFWMCCILFGLTVTTAGGIMVNHYVSIHALTVWCLRIVYN